MMLTQTDSFAQARKAMVDGQVRVNDVTRHSVKNVMMTTPREAFLPDTMASLAYAEVAVSMGEGRSLLTPVILSRMINAAQLDGHEKVLLIGGGSGYTAALLAQLSSHVTVLEEPALAEIAHHALAGANIHNVTVQQGILSQGVPQSAPYDTIFIEGAIEVIPPALLAQIKEGTAGQIITILQTEKRSQAVKITHAHGHMSVQPLFDAQGWLLPSFEKQFGFEL